MKRNCFTQQDTTDSIPCKKHRRILFFSYLLEDEYVIHLILEYSTHAQIGKWVQICKKMRNFIQTYFAEFFEYDHFFDLNENLKRICENDPHKNPFFLQVVRLLISKGAQSNSDNSEMIVKYTCEKGNVDMLKFLMFKGYSLLPSMGLLNLASVNGHSDMIQFLVKIKYPLEAKIVKAIWICGKSGSSRSKIVNYLIHKFNPTVYYHNDGSTFGFSNYANEKWVIIEDDGYKTNEKMQIVDKLVKRLPIERLMYPPIVVKCQVIIVKSRDFCPFDFFQHQICLSPNNYKHYQKELEQFICQV